jgi:hypothetical protein
MVAPLEKAKDPTPDGLRAAFGVGAALATTPEKQAITPEGFAKKSGYKLREVVVAVLVFYAMLGVFGTRGFYRWTMKLPVSTASARLRHAARTVWGHAAALGLERPAVLIERGWLEFQEADPLLYPKSYAEVEARRRARLAHVAATKRTARPVSHKSANGGPSVLLIGDSIMAGIGPVIKNDVLSSLKGSAEIEAKVATGLARPDVFDWRGELRKATETDRYDYIVMLLGTNDSQDFVEGGHILAYGTEEWVKAYTSRVAELMAAACAGADRGVWIGLPPMKSAAFNRKALRINNWAQRQAAAHPCMQYVSLDHVIGDEQGSFTSYRKIKNSLEKVRNVDGIHITKAGGALVSAALVELLSRR